MDLDEATKLVGRAISNGPTVVDAHLAAGHLALHMRESTSAAHHFGRAIACAPYSAEAHEVLGRMLLEAGQIELGSARIDDALAMAPDLTGGRWARARAWHLDGRREEAWHECAELIATGAVRHLLVERLAWWERDLEKATQHHRETARVNAFFDAGLQPLLFAAIEGAWDSLRSEIIERATSPSANLRRASFLAQLVAEIAGFVGDQSTCIDMVKLSVAKDIYDLQWMEKCPLLDGVRGYKAFSSATEVVRERANAIVDALYGDSNDAPLGDRTVTA